jgi:hypothetical protein
MVEIPQNAAGILTEPPPSVPIESEPIPNPTEALHPPEEPPAVFEKSYGFVVIPVTGESVTPFHPNIGLVVLPTKLNQ